MNRLFHYTVGDNLPSILADGELTWARAGKEIAVWFSFDPDWEVGALKFWPVPPPGRMPYYGRDDLMRICGGLARIEVAPESAPSTWQDHVRLIERNPVTMVQVWVFPVWQTLRTLDMPRWRLSYKPVPRSKWLAVETDTGHGWGPMRGWEPS